MQYDNFSYRICNWYVTTNNKREDLFCANSSEISNSCMYIVLNYHYLQKAKKYLCSTTENMKIYLQMNARSSLILFDLWFWDQLRFETKCTRPTFSVTNRLIKLLRNLLSLFFQGFRPCSNGLVAFGISLLVRIAWNFQCILLIVKH